MRTSDARFQDSDGQCVWVSAGLLSDHICDRDFDCDHCPLHLALSPLSGRKEPDKAFWPKDRLYSDGHFWLKQTGPHTARLGLTELAVQLLHPVSRWTLERSAPQAGDVRIFAELSCGKVRLVPPCRVQAFRPNPCLEIDALWPAADPWLSGFLLEFDFEDWRTTSAGWLELAQAAPRYGHHRELVHRMLASPQARPSALTAAADGGLPAAGLLSVCGHAAYGNLLSAILKCTEAEASDG